MSRALLLAALLAAVAVVLSSSRSSCPAGAEDCGADADTKADAGAEDCSADAGASEETNPLGANAACYVCHIPFVKEELSKVHLKAKVTCIKCHGLSAGHANDEDVGATKPDISYTRQQVDRMCRECHETHDAPATAVIACWLRRGLSLQRPAVCTDCHGTHKIEEPAEDEQEQPTPSP